MIPSSLGSVKVETSTGRGKGVASASTGERSGEEGNVKRDVHPKTSAVMNAVDFLHDGAARNSFLNVKNMAMLLQYIKPITNQFPENSIFSIVLIA